MKSELSFLMDLFLNDEVPSVIKKQVAERIRDVEQNLQAPTIPPLPRMLPIVPRGTPGTPGDAPPVVAMQSPSMQRIMQQHPDVPVNLGLTGTLGTSATPVTPAAAAALQQRAAIINKGINSDKPEPGRSGPRKF